MITHLSLLGDWMCIQNRLGKLMRRAGGILRVVAIDTVYWAISTCLK